VAGFNRAVAGAADFLGPDNVNAILELSGSSHRIPTFTGAVTEPQGAFSNTGIGQAAGMAGEAAASAAMGQFALKSLVKDTFAKSPSTLGQVVNQVANINPVTAGGIGAESSLGGSAGKAAGDTISPTAGAVGQVIGSVAAPVAMTAASFPFVSTTKGFNFINKLPKLQQDRIAQDIQNNPTDTLLASYINKGAGSIEKDALGLRALKQDVAPSVVALGTKGSVPDRVAVRDMATIMSKSADNQTYADSHSPYDVVGSNIKRIYDRLWSINKGVAPQVKAEAEKLKGTINVRDAIDTFVKRLGERKVKITTKVKDGKQTHKLNFDDSEFKKGTPPANAIEAAFNEVKKLPNEYAARSAHSLKSRLRDVVNNETPERGTLGKADRDVKEFIAKINEELNANYPKYARVNKKFSQTADALDLFAESFGKVNRKAKSLNQIFGARARTLQTNSATAPKLRDTIDNMEEVAKKNGFRYKGNINRQATAASQIEQQFYGVPESGKVTGKEVIEAARGSQFVQAKGIAEIATKGAKNLAGINQKNAIKSISDLSKDLKVRAKKGKIQSTLGLSTQIKASTK